MKIVKVPKEVQDVFAESIACDELAKLHDTGWFPSMKAIYYKHRSVKLELFAWKTLKIVEAGWKYNSVTGEATKEEPSEAAVKKPRKPRAKKVEPTVETQPITTKGE